MAAHQPKRIVLVDPTYSEPSDEPGYTLAALREAFVQVCQSADQIQLVASKEALFDALHTSPVDLVVLDYFLGDGQRQGIPLLQEIKAFAPGLLCLVVAEQGDVDMANRAIHAGATDFLVRGQQLPERVSTQIAKLRQLLLLSEQNRKLGQKVQDLRAQQQLQYAIIGSSPELKAVLEQIQRLASIPRPILIAGERGTGKELVARAIHKESLLGRPFVVVNCAAFPDALLEAELFGHEQGAFTGASHQSPGKFEQADGGSLFLDEIGHMSLHFQQKILRVVEYGTFHRVGGHQEVRADVRIIAATNADLHQAIEEGEFLADLYDRLAFEVITLPSLRQRASDIPLLAHHFLQQFTLEVPAFRGRRLSSQSLEALRAYPFPGNVRELKHIIERAVCRDASGAIMPEDLGLTEPAKPPPKPAPEAQPPAAQPPADFAQKMERYARRLLSEALQDARGNQAQAARDLGLSYHQFRYHYRKHFPK